MPRMPILLLAALGFASVVVVAPRARAQGDAADPVLIQSGEVQLRKSDYEAELLRLPPNMRPGFSNSAQRVNDLLVRLFVQKVLATQAKEEKLAERPANAARVRVEMERLLAQLRVSEVEVQAGREFDARKAQYEARARELYLVERKKYEYPERMTASHILFDLRKHSKEGGEKLAREARAKVLAGADFTELAKEVSEDPSVAVNGGRIEGFARADMDPAFAAAAFALTKPGEISEPVLSQFGWHIIKFESRTPGGVRKFEEVRDQIIAEARKKYVDDQRDAVVNAIRDDPATVVNKDAIDALVTRIDPELVKRLQEQAQKPAGAASPK